MKNLYVISGVTGMTGSELSRQFVSQGHTVIGDTATGTDAHQQNESGQSFFKHGIHLS